VNLIEGRWLKGHAGHPLNERCDVRANAEMAALRKTMSPGPARRRPERIQPHQLMR
jgi:ribonuclease HI